MSTEVITVAADDALQKAVNIFKEHDFRLLPVLRACNLAGVVSSE
ncbi:MAG: CBS domain-containing protein [Desulfobacterales bacterium]